MAIEGWREEDNTEHPHSATEAAILSTVTGPKNGGRSDEVGDEHLPYIEDIRVVCGGVFDAPEAL